MGLWSTLPINPAHQRAAYLTFGKEISQADLRAIAQGQVLADSAPYQTAEGSYRHAMRSPDQSVSEACKKANDFVREQYKKAWAAQAAGDRKTAMTEFSVGLHTLQDATSSSHQGFQVWDGDSSLRRTKNWGHGYQDIKIVDPSKDSELMKATKDGWDWFKAGKLPDGNLFGCECE
jgi:hypothetical protein